MEKKQIKKIILFVIITLLIFSIIYLLIWMFFFIHNTIPSGEGISKADWLIFLGSYLSFSGTFALGGVTVYQNIKQREDDKKRYLSSVKPNLEIEYEELSISDFKEKENQVDFIYFDINKFGNISNLSICKYLRKELDKYHSNKEIDDAIKKGDIYKSLSAISDNGELENKLQNFLFLTFNLSNVGRGTAINVNLIEDDFPLICPTSIIANNSKKYYYIIDASQIKDSIKINFPIKYSDIENNNFTENFQFSVSRDKDNNLHTSYNPIKDENNDKGEVNE